MVYGDDKDIIYVKERNNYVRSSNLRVVQVGHESMRLNSAYLSWLTVSKYNS